MNVSKNLIKKLGTLTWTINLVLLLPGLSWLILINSTAKPETTPIPYRSDSIDAPPITASISLPPDKLTTGAAASNPVETAFIKAIPSADGTALMVSASGVGATESQIILNVGSPDIGGGHRRAGAMSLSGKTYIATMDGFTPEMDIEGALNLTTTVGNQMMSTGDIDFERAFVQTSQIEEINLDQGAFSIAMPNLNTLAVDAYLLVMSTNAPAGSLPAGYSLVGSSYDLSPSGGLTQTDKPMTLSFNFQTPLPNDRDPHTLAVIGWDDPRTTAGFLGGELFEMDNRVVWVDRRFRFYALATTPVWCDSFTNAIAPEGLSTRQNTEVGPDEALILTTGAISGAATSIPITPTNAAAWKTLDFSAVTSATTGLTVDVLDVNDTVLLPNAGPETDLSSLRPATATIKLRATLTTTLVGESPALLDWCVSWAPVEYRVYLPLVLK